MRASGGTLRTRVGAVTLAVASVLSTGSSASAVDGEAITDDTTTVVVDDVTTTVETTTTEKPTTSDRPSAGPADIDDLAPPVRPGSTIQTRLPPPPPTTTTTLPPPPPEWVLPANSGWGRRAVYSKSLQRVWAVDGSGAVLKTHRVSGNLRWCDPRIGTYSVFSRSRYTYSIQNPTIKWGYMIRFTKGCEGGNIGFHEIPKKYGVPVQSIWQLGQPLSAGCVRQAVPDAQWMWNWAWVGTKVVVLP